MKRFLSFALALSMLISMLPIMPSVAAEGVEKYEYNFTSSAFSESSTSFTYLDLKTKTMSDVREAVSTPWKWAGFAYTYTLYSNETGVQMNVEPHRAAGGHAYVALELDVKSGGEYIPSLAYKTQLGSLTADVYLIKNVDTVEDFTVETVGQGSNAEISEYVAKWKKGEIGGYQLADDAVFSSTEEQSVTFEKCTLDSDSTYYLIFNFVGYSDPKDVVILYHAKSFTLTDTSSIVKDELKSVELSSDAEAVTVGSELKTSVYGTYTVSGRKALTEGIEYTSSDESVATVS
ncbi:MAG: hypothetical protein IJ299_02455, partial [Oscillospiraceae bacterium]|nr:hypothetical protein [Oscillospiraceae bacterium]